MLYSLKHQKMKSNYELIKYQILVSFPISKLKDTDGQTAKETSICHVFDY